MINLLPHPVTVSGVTLEPAFGSALEFTPVLRETDNPFPALVGFTPPAGMPLLETGTDVLVPRFAAAVTWATDNGLVPHCLPLDPGGRQQDGSFVCYELDPAPDGLAVSFVELDALLPLPKDPAIHRATPGTFTVEVFDGPDLTALHPDWHAIRLSDGSVQVPELPADWGHFDAWLVPLDGAIIDAVHARYPLLPLLVGDVPKRGQRTRLFQVR